MLIFFKKMSSFSPILEIVDFDVIKDEDYEEVPPEE